ncbi:hypothetical protein CBR_g66769 [Chara braunii]|uniref:Uncharacterized protein n=1 Tax=Chara braunii TaxID=69332 RepID=A0A388K9M1_CHABU|nr:hypothetical protein CBR_g66769 [Chara braunii]|eukprot:GBG66633.1 hypothetical protein CBR_g66769 [Chara braunii]
MGRRPFRQPIFHKDDGSVVNTPRAESSRKAEERQRTKIPAGSGPKGVLVYVLQQRRLLTGKNKEQLKVICAAEGVEYTTKAPMIEKIIEGRVKIAYEGFVFVPTPSPPSIPEEEDTPGNCMAHFVCVWLRQNLVDCMRLRNQLWYEQRSSHLRLLYDKCATLCFVALAILGEKLGKENYDDWACRCHLEPGWEHSGLHVMTRIRGIPGIPDFLRNSRNVPRVLPKHWMLELGKQIVRIASYLRSSYVVDKCELEGCWDLQLEGEDEAYLFYLNQWFLRLKNFVCIPIDRNTADTLVVCPVLYRHYLDMSFNWNLSFRAVNYGESDVLFRMREVFLDLSLHKLGKWDVGGRFEEAYVLPKHKDLSRWRPISPTCTEPTRLASSRAATALNALLFALAANTGFNLKAVMHVLPGMQAMDRDFRQKHYHDLVPVSFDVKDMFVSLAHTDVLRAVD